LHTPLWGDDYTFLLKARAAQTAGLPWWSEFWPATPVRFWRPLSQGGYWRVMLIVFGGTPLAMHVASLCLHAIAAAGVGVCAWCLARACGWSRARPTAWLVAVTYGALSVHMLPVYWASAANNSMLTLFSAMSLAAWLASGLTHGARRLCA